MVIRKCAFHCFILYNYITMHGAKKYKILVSFRVQLFVNIGSWPVLVLCADETAFRCGELSHTS